MPQHFIIELRPVEQDCYKKAASKNTQFLWKKKEKRKDTETSPVRTVTHYSFFFYLIAD